MGRRKRPQKIKCAAQPRRTEINRAKRQAKHKLLHPNDK